eukprot:CAMPEP_0177669180 /NCGR_PEP_ID=MMETSP0447-20121125/23279_1 /TAXON_ID=0 /ORGANISM="Stygamoeba regulata, Strain BSH-02190019" /LENGTH=1036 /DNA_ID=CAMNT_0019175981 /DNA_START=170 /DNA_END=3280 /DNA_ORIENTATION=+
MSLKVTLYKRTDYFSSPEADNSDEINKLLDSKERSHKLEGMKKLIAMICKGQDVSKSFPAVVKNVIVKDTEVKKLVYIYLVHYAEVEPDSALLSINNFQKDLNDQNQLIRAQALRVMSSIRVKVITQIILLAIQKCVNDSSAYVRKAAAHAICKVFSLDPDTRDSLIEILQTLLNDRMPMVLGSAVSAFSEVCPERFDLIHPHFRKLCKMLADTDEWGQVAILNMMTRYGRDQFMDPDRKKEKKPKTPKPPKQGSDSDSDWSDEDDEDDDFFGIPQLDPDHRMLLNAVSPLLQSRNPSVVLAVTTLYFYLAPRMEAVKVAKSLSRLARSDRETSFVVLSTVASMAATRPKMFAPFVTDYFVDSVDPSYSRQLKLEILTYVANESNINKILREFNSYIHSDDKAFVASTIKAITRCAINIEEVTETCIHGLMAHLTHPNETVVAESVIALKKLLQLGSVEHTHIVGQLAKILDRLEDPSARASVTWVIGEYCEKVPLLAPDVFRVLAKGFVDEHDQVKLQILTLGAKLYLSNPEQTHLIFQYVLNLCKYDRNYDIRDRARLIRGTIYTDTLPAMRAHGKRLMFATKQPPEMERPSEERARFALGSLSHVVNHVVSGYDPIPDFPEERPDPSVRDTFVGPGADGAAGHASSPYGMAVGGEDAFYSDDESGSWTGSESGSWSGSESGSWTGSQSGSWSGSDDDGSGSWSSSEGEEEDQVPQAAAPTQSESSAISAPVPAPAATTSADLLGGLESLSIGETPVAVTAATVTAPVAAFAPSAAPLTAEPMPFIEDPLPGSADAAGASVVLAPVEHESQPLLSEVVGGGLSAEYKFVRRPSSYGEDKCTVKLTLVNHSANPLTNIDLDDSVSLSEVVGFPVIPQLQPGARTTVTVALSFESLSLPIQMAFTHSDAGPFKCHPLPPLLAEALNPFPVSAEKFEQLQAQLGGMNEETKSFSLPQAKLWEVAQVVVQNANVHVVSSDVDAGRFRFAGRTKLAEHPVLISIQVADLNSGAASLRLNSEDTILIARLGAALVRALSE